MSLELVVRHSTPCMYATCRGCDYAPSGESCRVLTHTTALLCRGQPTGKDGSTGAGPRHHSRSLHAAGQRTALGRRFGRQEHHGARSGGGGEGPRRYPCGGAMGPPSPPIFWHFCAIFICFHGNSAYLRPCYHALRHPFGAADRAMLHN